MMVLSHLYHFTTLSLYDPYLKTEEQNDNNNNNSLLNGSFTQDDDEPMIDYSKKKKFQNKLSPKANGWKHTASPIATSNKLTPQQHLMVEYQVISTTSNAGDCWTCFCVIFIVIICLFCLFCFFSLVYSVM